eukprot:6826258-Prymnesium_polylepis.1
MAQGWEGENDIPHERPGPRETAMPNEELEPLELRASRKNVPASTMASTGKRLPRRFSTESV